MSGSERSGDPCNVLFLCTGNSSRSIMAEAILNRIGPPRLHACSAGSRPKGAVHPEVLRLLNGRSYDTSRLRSKSWDEFTDGTKFDHIVTLCNGVAGEVCPIIFGQPARTHWDVPDPSSVRGTQFEMEIAFRQTFEMLSERIEAFIRQ